MTTLAPPTRRRTAPRSAALDAATAVDALFALTLVSLFATFEFSGGIGKLRPFDLMAFICLGAVLPTLLRSGPRFPAAGVFHVLALVIHVGSAVSVSTLNGLREGLQVGGVLAYAVALSTHLSLPRRSRVIEFTAWMVSAIAVWLIAWHVERGMFTRWKLLVGPRTVFVLFPALAAGALCLMRRPSTAAFLAIFCVCGVLVLFSGERKALIGMAVLGAAWFGVFNPKLVMAAIITLVAAPAVVALDPSGYAERQWQSIITSREYSNFWQYSETELPESMSDAQRQFAMDVGLQMLGREPVFGIGTNQYLPRVNAEMGEIPSYLRLGIHGEFGRTLVENGILGFAVYLMAWLMSAVVLLRGIPWRLFSRGIRNAALVRLLIFAGALAQVSFEGANTFTMVSFLAPLFLPLLVPDEQLHPSKKASA